MMHSIFNQIVSVTRVIRNPRVQPSGNRRRDRQGERAAAHRLSGLQGGLHLLLLQLLGLDLDVEARLHVLLQLSLQLRVGVSRAGQQGHPGLRLALELGGRLGLRLHQLLLGQGEGQAGHGQAAGGQAAGQLGRGRVEAGRVLHRRPFGRVVLLLVLLLPGDLDRLRGRGHPSWGGVRNSTIQEESGQKGGEEE